MTRELNSDTTGEMILTPREQLVLAHFDGKSERLIAEVWAQLIQQGSQLVEFPLDEYEAVLHKLVSCGLIEMVDAVSPRTSRITDKGAGIISILRKDEKRFKEDFSISIE